MERTIRLGCVVLAAGNAARFGENKLAAEWNGVPLIRRALEAVPSELFSAVAVVTQYPEVEQLAEEYHFTAVHNPHPDWGISESIRLGLSALGDCGAALFMVSDQPLLRRETVAALTRFYLAHPDRIAALGSGGVRGNPCIFPARFFPELRSLREDHGGNTVIRRHEDALLLWEVGPAPLTDVDTPEALRSLEEAVRKRTRC